MNKKETQQQERGQSLVLVALAMVGLIAFAGLALDGGLAYVTRRVAQNAADSGAIAGSYELHRQLWDEQFNAIQLDQDLILSKINQVVESHDVADTDDTPGNEINDNVRAFYVSRGAGSSGCSNVIDTDYEELCQLDPDTPCNANDVVDRAVGISIEVDVPFQPIFAGIIGWNEIRVSNRANDFDQRTAAIVNAEDRGYNSDLWAIFAFIQGTTSGPSTFIEVDPVAQPPTGFAFANVHSQGSFSVGNHFPIMGQVTYCTTGGCINCFNALLLPEQTQKNINLPDFTQFATLAEERAEAGGRVSNGETWGGPINESIGPEHFIQDGIWFINGTLTIPQNTLAVGQNLFIYATGNVTINGFFFAQNLSIISDGIITINGTLKNTNPYPTGISDPAFNSNVAVLWSSLQGGTAIDITSTIVNTSSDFSNNSTDIGGAVMAPDSTININANNINTTVRGSVIGNVVWVNSSTQTGAQTRIQYNGNYFPAQPNRIELLK